MSQVVGRDYSLTGEEGSRALARGLAEAEWYASPIPREQMRELLRRRNYPAVRDTIIWFGLLLWSCLRASLRTCLWACLWARLWTGLTLLLLSCSCLINLFS